MIYPSNNYKNNRDVEIPSVIDFIHIFGCSIQSLLDVGAHDSFASYAPLVWRFMDGKVYHAIDILEDPKTAEFVDRYIQCNVLNYTFDSRYDLVMSISAIEHCGMTTYKSPDPKHERLNFFQRLCDLSQRLVFVTFPFGLEGQVEGQYANITYEELRAYDRMAFYLNFKPLTRHFYFNEFPQQGKLWREVSRNEAAQVPLNPAIDIQCVGVCSWIKG